MCMSLSHLEYSLTFTPKHSEQEKPMSSPYDVDKQLDRTSDWLKFAEAKSAIALTLVSAMLFGIIQSREVFRAEWLFYTMITFLLVIIMLLLYTVQPILNNKSAVRLKNLKPEDANLLYFRHIQKMDIDVYRKELSKRSDGSYAETGDGSGTCKNKRYFNDVTNQIYENAGITNRKFCLFKYACCGLYVILFILLVAIVIQLITGAGLFNFQSGLAKP
jgi:hypothetical protein